MSSRRKNKHPKRAENAKTVLKGEKEERPVLLCLRIPDEEDYDDVDFEIEQNEIRKENFIYSFLTSVRQKMESKKK